MMSDTLPPTCSRIDETRFHHVVDAVTRVLAEVDSHKSLVFDRDFWRWQYQETPGNNTRVYGIFTGDVLKGYYHVPVYNGQVNGRACQLAMVQEVAVSPDLRGQGMFRKLADFVTHDLCASGIEAAYTFPNRRSIHTFLKYNGYRQISTLATHVLPVRCGDLLRSKVNLCGLERILGRAVDRCFQSIRVALSPNAVIYRHPSITPKCMRCSQPINTGTRWPCCAKNAI